MGIVATRRSAGLCGVETHTRTQPKFDDSFFPVNRDRLAHKNLLPFAMASNTDALNNSLRYPFSNDPAADVIIRSQSIDFRVRKAVLSETSGLFKQMFTLPQGGDNGSSPADRSFSDERSVDGLPVISVSEDEETMSTFLRCVPFFYRDV